MLTARKFLTPLALLLAALAVGFLYIGPPLMIARHLALQGKPFILTSEGHRTDLHYLTRGREVYDGRSPSGDPSLDASPPSPLNILPPLVIGAFLGLAGGDVGRAYLLMLFVFPALAFLLFYALGREFFPSRLWSFAFALIAVITPVALRIFNFDSGA